MEAVGGVYSAESRSIGDAKCFLNIFFFLILRTYEFSAPPAATLHSIFRHACMSTVGVGLAFCAISASCFLCMYSRRLNLIDYC